MSEQKDIYQALEEADGSTPVYFYDNTGKCAGKGTVEALPPTPFLRDMDDYLSEHAARIAEETTR